MNMLDLKYTLCSYRGNEKLLTRYRLAKKGQEIDAKICKKIQLKLRKRKNILNSLFVKRAFADLPVKTIQKPVVNIYDEERNEKLVQQFRALGQIKIVKRNDTKNFNV